MKRLWIIVLCLMMMCAFASAETLPHRTGTVADVTSLDFVRLMGAGWNLGNTLESTGGPSETIAEFETSWGNPATTQAIIDVIADMGFQTVRIPVAWSNLMADDYTICPDLMDRVEEVAGYCLNRDMYVIINIHWDGGWDSLFATDYDTAIAKFTAIWSQVSERFRDYDDHVIFEALNEVGWTQYFNYYGGTAAVDANPEKAKQGYDLLYTINQTFVDLVRASGGNNAGRFLLIPGYNTDIELTCHEFYRMPDDPAEHLLISVHYYTPWDFVGLAEDSSYAPMRTKWPETSKDIQDLNYYMNLMKTFTNAGYGVVLGEYSVCDGIEYKDAASIRKWDTMVTKTALSLGYCPVFWDNGALLLDRATLTFYDDELAQELSALAQSAQ
ncbi:MAG TPA: glycoside hydrolase family 5 protein [Candidatus Limiplasma sp.]|nr:glycoside hydrolase family 5 protein [Candidatus Limiplasma sp.]